MITRILIFHPAIAPYRIDFFNSLCSTFAAKVCLYQKNLKSQKFDQAAIQKQLVFSPEFFPKRTMQSYRHCIKEFQPNVVVVNEFGKDTIIVLLLKMFMRNKFKVISICDDSMDIVEGKSGFSTAHEIGRKILTPFLDNLILCNEDVEAWFLRKYQKGIYFPIIYDEDRLSMKYKKLQDLASDTKLKYNLDGKFVFLFVGRLVKQKNIPLLIESFQKCNIKNASLVIVGDGEESSSLKELSKDDSKIIFTGRLEGGQLFQWYNVADCFVLPSLLEPFGAVVNEALVAGCWCLVSRNAGSSCLIDEGSNGFIFDPTDAEYLASLMKKSFELLKDDKEKRNRMTMSFGERMENLVKKIHKIATENTKD